jgi:hypothetical protein
MTIDDIKRKYLAGYDEKDTGSVLAYLRGLRKDFHPDVPATGHEEKFKEVQLLISHYDDILEGTESKSLILHNPQALGIFVNDKMKQYEVENEKLMSQNGELKSTLQRLIDENTKAKERIQTIDINSVERQNAYIKKYYEQESKGKYLIPGIIASLSMISLILSKGTGIFEKLMLYTVADPIYINSIFLLLMGLSILAIALNIISRNAFKKYVSELNTSISMSEFYEALPNDEFTELDVAQYVKSKMKESWILRLCGFKIRTNSNIEVIKNVILCNLLRKDVLTVSTKSGINRHFKIRERENGFMWTQFAENDESLKF